MIRKNHFKLKRKETILLIIIFWAVRLSNLFGQQVELEIWKDELIKSIHKEVVAQVEKGCLEGSTVWWKSHFESQLQYFPIELSLNRVTDISKELKKGEYIILELFYPFVGFDPETGYETCLYLKKRKRIRKAEIYNETVQGFKPLIGNHKYFNKRMKSKSDCYGTGYLFITAFDKDLKIKKMHIALSIEMKMK